MSGNRVKRSKDGKFAGSIGSGRTAPTAAPQSPHTPPAAGAKAPAPTSQDSLNAMYAGFQAQQNESDTSRSEAREVERALGDRTMQVGDHVVVNADADGQGIRFRYRVVKRTPKTVTVRMVRVNGTLAEPETFRVQKSGTTEYLKMHGGHAWGVLETT